MDTSSLALEAFHRGAEADLFRSKVDPWETVVKRRIRKGYRHESLDDSIRRERTISEATLLHEAKAAGVRVPSVVGINIENNTIVMTHVDGVMARDCLDSMSRNDSMKLFKSLGAQIGLLHTAGIVHGDLTTSNVIVAASGAPVIVDLGMARRSTDPEDRGVDLHLLQRSIATSHRKDLSPLLRALSTGYRETAGEDVFQSTSAKAREVARRGRYFAIR